MIETLETTNRARQSRQRVLALFLPATAVLYVAAAAINPKGVDQIVTTTSIARKVLPIAEHHTSQLYLSGTLTILALGALGVSFAAIATLIRGRSSTLATVVALFAGIGYFSGAIINVLVGFNLAAVASAHLTQGAGAKFLVTTFNSGSGKTFLTVYAIAEYLAPLLMGIALWRSRSVPRWLAVLFLIGLAVAQQVPSDGAVTVLLLMVPFAVAMVLLALRIWRDSAVMEPDSQLVDVRRHPTLASS